MSLAITTPDGPREDEGPDSTAGQVIGLVRAATTGDPGKAPVTNESVAL